MIEPELSSSLNDPQTSLGQRVIQLPVHVAVPDEILHGEY
jgi:hypothetical protein